MPQTKMCQHCKASKVTRPRGLCNPCYYTASIRSQYERFAVQVHDGKVYQSGYWETPACGLRTPERPTMARPGTLEKISVFQERIERGEQLFHPDDFNTLPQRFEELYID